MTWEIALWIVASGLGTALGAAGLLAVGVRPARRLLDGLLGFTAGVMAAAVSFSLIVPGLEAGTWTQVVGGFLLGVAFVLVLDIVVPHAHHELAERGRYVVIDELIPETEGHGNERLATLAAMGGFALLLALDNGLG